MITYLVAQQPQNRPYTDNPAIVVATDPTHAVELYCLAFECRAGNLVVAEFANPTQALVAPILME